MKTVLRVAAAAAATTLSLTSFVACSGDDEKPSSNESADADGDDEVTPEEVMGFAKTILDETSGVRLTLATDDEPDTDAFLKSAEGVLTNAPAFDGTASGTFEGFPATDVGIISVDDQVYVDILGGWRDFEPEEFCAPDPALLLDPEAGVSTVLSSAEDLDEGESERGGEDNDEILTPYTGTVPGAAIKNILPCAPGDSYDATFTITADGELRQAVLTGEFFEGGGDLTYTIGIDEYDVEQEITKP